MAKEIDRRYLIDQKTFDILSGLSNKEARQERLQEIASRCTPVPRHCRYYTDSTAIAEAFTWALLGDIHRAADYFLIGVKFNDPLATTDNAEDILYTAYEHAEYYRQNYLQTRPKRCLGKAELGYEEYYEPVRATRRPRHGSRYSLA